jgi:hypothetical protein
VIFKEPPALTTLWDVDDCSGTPRVYQVACPLLANPGGDQHAQLGFIVACTHCETEGLNGFRLVRGLAVVWDGL